MAIETFSATISVHSLDSFQDETSPPHEFGAEIRFLGIVRDHEDGQAISGIHYTCYLSMAEREISRIGAAMTQESPLHRARIHHRTGFVPAGEPSLWIWIQTPHSAQAFALCQEYLRRIKSTLPIWKEPVWI